ncbi:MAG: cyclic nucleotide-binding domain-containing protein [Verrucomicrobiota bacterium]|nr:cyclic nucleotide-binding domain-containing protein [Verrucomicrobiota bacterium]
MTTTAPTRAPLRKDFFSFCTSLDLQQRKALGQLSRVIHVAPNTLIYRQGEPSDSLYIINRGVVEVIVQSHDRTRQQSLGYLSRGDCLGEVGLLTGMTRSATVRTCEPCSLQYFSEENFYKLIEQVPSFFHYLAVRLAERLQKTSNLAYLNSNCLDLSGNLSNFDLVTIFQTIAQSSKTGELRISDDNARELGRFYFDAGAPTYSKFHNLHGVQGLWQLFLDEHLKGSFAFYIDASPAEEDRILISQSSTEVLMNALQMRDEYPALREQIKDFLTPLVTIVETLTFEEEMYAEAANAVFAFLKNQPASVTELTEKLNFCEFHLYAAITNMIKNGQIR